MEITVDILKSIAPWSKQTNYKLLPGIALWMNYWFPKFDIDTKAEICHFTSQTAHESDSYNTMEEYASGKAYENRLDLGNNKPGDGVRYKGKGLLETTGKANYAQLDTIIPKYFQNGISFVNNPELLKDPQYAVWSACIFWDTRDLNMFANKPDTADIFSKKYNRYLTPVEYITLRVNGGFTHLKERQEFYDRAKHIIQ